jgi:hypothetical protein
LAFSYVVRATLTSREAMEEFSAWLRDGHIADVCAAGAMDGHVVALDPLDGQSADEHVLEARYRFESRAAFIAYVRDHAPRLREEGLKVAARVGGVTFARTCGEIVFEAARA